MKKDIQIVRDAIILIKQLPESDLKHEAILTLNLLLSEAIVHSDWILNILNKEIEENFTL